MSIQALNYSAAIVDAIPVLAKGYQRNNRSYDAATLKSWRGMIQRSTKFVLPDAGHFFTAGAGLPIGIFPQRLPYKLLSLEVPYSLSNGDEQGEVSTRRHILCHEANLVLVGDAYRIDNEPREPEGFFVYIFSYRDRFRQWMPQHCAGYVRYDWPTVSPDERTCEPRGWDLRNQKSFCKFLSTPLLNETYDACVLERGARLLKEDVSRDTAEEVRIAMEFLQVLSCRNVSAVENAPPEKLNKARKRTGKMPIDKFYTLAVGDVHVGAHAGGHVFGGSYKVREHFRCGHIRRLADRSIWVTETVVALGSREGRVVKQYAVPEGLVR